MNPWGWNGYFLEAHIAILNKVSMRVHVFRDDSTFVLCGPLLAFATVSVAILSPALKYTRGFRMVKTIFVETMFTQKRFVVYSNNNSNYKKMHFVTPILK